MKRVWLICVECGYNTEVFENEVYDYDRCNLCGGKMTVDLNQGKQMGDNFPNINQSDELERLDKALKKVSNEELLEQEIKNSFNMIGNNATWEMLECLSDVKLRLRYRKIFFKLGGTVPDKGE